MTPTPNATRRPIRTVLVANRGEIAQRVIRSARDLGIATVALFSDADANAPHVALADRAVRLPGRTAGDTYLRGDLVIDAARRTGADAVHPGYGFLSENAGFARACERAGIVFVGPPPDAIERMGSKIEAKRLMDDAGVPVLPGATVPEGVAPADLAALGATVGYPLLVKATYGGGGRGMRIVDEADALADAVAGAEREAAAAFGDGSVFLERLVRRPRHVEVQVFGDAFGNVAHLFERECSIQRRHQKIVEEAPSTALDGDTRARMCEAAVTAARAIGYVNAGTVEFVLDGDGAFWFLEVNTRLQVEHPVTELVTGIDLVAVQLAIAEGSPLPPEVVDARTTGHAIEARLYAEDVGAGYLPVTGTLHRFRIPARDGIRVDAGYTDGSEITTFYDALLAKVVAWAPTRDEATRVLVGALRSAEIHGPPTNRDLLVSVLDHAAWTRGDTDTEFLDRHLAARDESGAVADGLLEQHALAAALATRAARRTPLPRGIPYAWRNVGPAHQVTQYRAGEQVVDVDLTGLGARAIVHAAARDHVDLELDGAREVVRVHRVGVTVFVDSAEGSTTLEELPRFPTPASEEAEGSLLAPLPGSVVQLPVAVGDVVHVGDVLIALEAMKMEHAIRAPRDGVVTEVRVVLGEQVDTGAVLVVVEPADRREPDPVAGAGAG